jgi:heme-degrading monooxygenase HmoA
VLPERGEVLLTRSVLYVHAIEGRREELVDRWTAIGTVDKSLQQEGCLSVELQVPQEDTSPILVTALWATRDAYQGWLDNPWRHEATRELGPLLAKPLEGELYDVRVAGGNSVVSATEPEA